MKKLFCCLMVVFAMMNFGAEDVVLDLSEVKITFQKWIREDVKGDDSEKNTQTFAEWLEEKRGREEAEYGAVFADLDDVEHCMIS